MDAMIDRRLALEEFCARVLWASRNLRDVDGFREVLEVPMDDAPRDFGLGEDGNLAAELVIYRYIEAERAVAGLRAAASELVERYLQPKESPTPKPDTRNFRVLRDAVAALSPLITAIEDNADLAVIDELRNLPRDGDGVIDFGYAESPSDVFFTGAADDLVAKYDVYHRAAESLSGTADHVSDEFDQIIL